MPEPNSAATVLKGLATVPEPVVRAAVGFVESLLGEPLKVAGTAIADQVEMWKWENRVRIAARAQEILKEERVAARIVPPAFLLPVVEAAGYTDDPTLQEMWARLLASGVKDDAAQQPMFARVLRDMSSTTAREFRDCCTGPVEWAHMFTIKPDSTLFIGGQPPVTPDEGYLLSLGLVVWYGARIEERTLKFLGPSLVGYQFGRAVMPELDAWKEWHAPKLPGPRTPRFTK